MRHFIATLEQFLHNKAFNLDYDPSAICQHYSFRDSFNRLSQVITNDLQCVNIAS